MNNTDNSSQHHEQKQSISKKSHQIEGQDYDTDFPIIEDPSRAVIHLRNIAIGHAISQGRDYISPRGCPNNNQGCFIHSTCKAC